MEYIACWILSSPHYLLLSMVILTFEKNKASGGSREGSRSTQEPPFWLHLALRSIPYGTPLSGYRTKKTAAMAHLRMLLKKFVRKQINWTCTAGRLSQIIGMGVVLSGSGHDF